jgi:hypothetical protein
MFFPYERLTLEIHDLLVNSRLSTQLDLDTSEKRN